MSIKVIIKNLWMLTLKYVRNKMHAAEVFFINLMLKNATQTVNLGFTLAYKHPI